MRHRRAARLVAWFCRFFGAVVFSRHFSSPAPSVVLACVWRRCVAAEETAVVVRVTSVAGRAYSLVKSDVGLIIILLAYSFLGAVILHHAEYERGQQLKRELNEHKIRCIAGIVNASLAFHSRLPDGRRQDDNLSEIVESLVDVYVHHKEHLRPNSKAPEWTYWGALFFCGTVFTTVGLCSFTILYRLRSTC